MSLKFTHKPNYFFFAQSLINFLVNKIQQQTAVLTEITIHSSDLHTLFNQDFASATANLEGILNIADNYHVKFEQPEFRLIDSYKIHSGENYTVTFFLGSNAVSSLLAGENIIAPDATSYE